MSKELFFSLIIPVYNVEKYIKECLDSILFQNYKNLEIIIINDGSSDNTKMICDVYEQNYEFVSVIDKTNSGTASARNTGIKRAKGKYLWFIDGDDLIAENSLTFLTDLLDNNDIAVCNFGKIDLINGVKQPVDLFNQTEILIGENILTSIPSSVCFSVFNREFILKSGLFFNERNYFEDEYFNLELYCTNKFKMLSCNIPFYIYRKFTKNSKTNTRDPKKLFDKCVSMIDLCQYIDIISVNVLRQDEINYKKRQYIEYGLHFLISYLKSDSSLNKKELLDVFRSNIAKIPISGKRFKKTNIPRLLYNLNIKVFLLYVKFRKCRYIFRFKPSN